MSKAFAIVTTSRNRFNVAGLQDYRPIGAFSFMGRYRVIDFPLSSLSNSGIDRIQVYVRKNPRSLAEHVGNGRSYNINSKKGKLQLLFTDFNEANDIYNTDIAGYMDNLKVIRRMQQPYAIITPSYYVFTQDYEELLQRHIQSGADITLLYQKVNNAKSGYHRCDVLNLNRQKGVKSIEMNNGAQDDRNIFMDTFIMKKELLIELVEKAHNLSSIYTLNDIINMESDDLDIRAVQHKGYFAPITDFKSYFDAHMGLLNNEEANAMFSTENIVYTPTSDSSPTRYYPGASVKNCIISNSCEIKGTLENCVIGRNVNIGKGAVLKNCVVLANATIGDGVVMENQVIDKWAQLIHVKELIAPPEDPGYIRRDDIL